MTEINRRIRELTESRAALERRLGELSEENDRLRAAHAEVFTAHKDERDRRQRFDVLIHEANAIISDLLHEASNRPQPHGLEEHMRRRSATWAELARKRYE